MEREARRRRAEALDRYWDALVADSAAEPSPDVDEVSAAALRRLRPLGEVPGLATARERIWANLTHDSRQTPGEKTMLNASVLELPIDRPSFRANHRRDALPQRGPRLRFTPESFRWALAQAATALLLIGTLLIAYFTTFRHDEQPLFMPAMGTPVPTDAAETPVAEFVWQTKGSPDLPLSNPINPAIDPQGNLWVADGRNQFQIFAPDGAFLEAWGTPGSAEGQFDFVDPAISDGHGQAAAAFDGAGNLYVVDSGNRRVQKFGSDRRFITAWGGEGRGDGQFLAPTDLAVDGQGRVYVTDQDRDDIQVFTADGGFLAAWGADAYGGITVAPDGNVWFTDWAAHRVQKYSPDGELLATWAETGTGEGQFLNPSDVAVDGQGRVYLADFGNNRVQVFDADGRFLTEWGQGGSDEGEFYNPTSLVLDGAGNVYVAEEGYRIQKFRLLPPLGPD